MNQFLWLLLVVMAILMWSATALLYKAGVPKEKEEHICLKYSVSTDPLLAVYPVFVMIGGRVFMKEKVSKAQYLLLLGVVAGSVMVIVDTVF